MPQQPERLSASLLAIRGEAVAEPVKPMAIDGLAAIAHKKTQTVTVTYRLEPDRHLALKKAAVEYGISIQQIIDHALKQIGI